MAKLTGLQARQMLTQDGQPTVQAYEILNAIRNEASSRYQGIVPPADDTNIGEVGKGVTKYNPIQNEFIDALIDRISLVVVKRKSMTNPLAKFKKGMLPLGRDIEEIFTDLVKAKKYDAPDSEATVFKREVPDTKVYFHRLNRRDFYKQTIQEESLSLAFTDWGTFDNFLASIINAIYNSAEVDEYLYMMKLVNTAITDKDIKEFEIELKGEDEAKDGAKLIQMFRTVATRLTLPMGSREFNKAGVHTVTDLSDVHILLTPELEASVDVNVLASSFNMDKASFIGNRTLVDGFKDENVQAVIIDKNWFMVYDKLHKMANIYNPQGLYWNYNYHVQQVMSYSQLENAVVIKKKSEGGDKELVVSPATADVKAGESATFTAEVKDKTPETTLIK